jgi:outer membrane receptor for ferric coprogen and ferric-rhodotorulic acid
MRTKGFTTGMLRRSIGTSVMMVLAAGMASAQVEHAYDIKAQPLRSALSELAQQSGLNLAVPARRTSGLNGNAVRGEMSAEQALVLLLRGTGLSLVITDGTVVLAPRSGNLRPDGSIALDAVALTAAPAGRTEGTNSYTTDVATGATGLPLTMKETPQSVSVVTNQRIVDQGLQTTQAVLAYATGVSSTTYETDRDNTWARGQWVSSYIIDGVLVDAGWGYFSGTGVHSSTATYDHIEVIRGASGLLTGTGDPAAAIRITRKQADSKEFSGSLQTSYGSWERMGAVFDVQSPLNADGSLRGRFIADVSSGDWFRDRYHVNKQTLYGTLAWDLSADTTLSFSLEHRDHDPRGSEWAGWPSVYSDGSLTDFSREFSSAPWWGSWDSEQDMATIRADHDFGNGWAGNATLSAVRKNYTTEHMRFYGQPDPVTGEGMTAFAQKDDVDARQIGIDAQIGGPVQAFGREHALNFGFHAGREWTRSRLYTPRDGQPAAGSVFDWTGDLDRPDWVLSSSGDWELAATQYAAYGSAKVSLADQLTAIIGLRYSDWESDDRHFTENTPLVGLIYDVSDSISAYASYTSIFNPQSAKDRSGDYLDPVQGRNKEIGLKGSWADERLNASFSWYNTYQDNVATEDMDQYTPDGAQAYYGADGVSAKGIEFEVSGELRQGLNIFFGAARMKLRNSDGSLAMTSLPRQTAKLFATWRLPGVWSKWTIGGGARWQNEIWNNVYPASGKMVLRRGGYMVADAMLRYEFNERCSAQLNVNNMFDKDYYNNASSTASYGEPRNAVFTLVSRF